MREATVRLQLFVLAYNLGNFLRQAELPGVLCPLQTRPSAVMLHPNSVPQWRPACE
jgi:hypothetical protein